MSWPFNFIRRPTQNLGVGTTNDAFGPFVTRPLLALRGAGLTVQRQLMTQQPAQVFSPQKVTAVSYRGSGVYLSDGGPKMQHLTDFEARRTGADRSI